MDRKNIDFIAKTPDDKLVLAKVWDKINGGIRKNILSSTCFLSERELEMTRYLFGDLEGLHPFGGYENAQRKMLIYLPEYMDETALWEDGPVHCLRASFYQGDTPTHRDFLGALIGSGVAREAIGDICVGCGTCDFFVTEEVSPYLLQSFTDAGRTRLHICQIPLSDVRIPEEKFIEIRDTLASLRLDSIVSSGFRIPRSQAAQLICAGKASVNELPCEKPDRAICQSDTVGVRGQGKIQLSSVGGQSKKGRLCVIIKKYI